jgi:DNA polymerase sigma
MEENFSIFLDNLKLTQNQREDAKKKYEGVINCMARHFYDRSKNDGDQYLFGSYKTKTAIRPIEGGSDVDVLFKIDKDTYEKYKNNTSGLLQECRNALKDTYSTTEEIHAWGKVVLVKFCDGTHNVEVLPALEKDDSKFCIPNTEDGGAESISKCKFTKSFCKLLHLE